MTQSDDIHKERILILDFGSQYTQNIARRVRELNVYSEIRPYFMKADDILKFQPKGIILSGGPASVVEDGAPVCDAKIFDMKIPILGVCYGMQLIAHLMKGEVDPAPEREFGRAELMVKEFSRLFDGVRNNSAVWMSHGDKISRLPPDFRTTAYTGNSPIAAIENSFAKIYGLQFHPEVSHSVDGQTIIGNFLFNICKCKHLWKPKSFVQYAIDGITAQVGSGKVL